MFTILRSIPYIIGLILISFIGYQQYSFYKKLSDIQTTLVTSQNELAQYKEADAANKIDIINKYNTLQKESTEKYINALNDINTKYNDVVASNNRMQSEINIYNSNLRTYNRETVENYAKTSSVLYGECKNEYIKLGQYTAKIDAELDPLTDASEPSEVQGTKK